MTSEADLDTILDAQGEIAFIATQDGVIERSNDRARAFATAIVPGQNLLALADTPARLKTFLSRCAGTNETMVGGISLRSNEGEAVRFRLYGRLLSLRREGRPPRLFIRCCAAHDERFSVLARKVDELNDEVRRRRHTQAVLEETVRERELLVREIHHRVKNNIQMLSSMLMLAQRESKDVEARALLADASRRLTSMGAVQQVLFQTDGLQTAAARELIQTLIDHVRNSILDKATFRIDVDESILSNDQALPLALVVNELVTNAVKHGIKEAPDAVITISFRAVGADYELCVHNPGKHDVVNETGRRASGIGLVKGLVRQLHGSFEITSDDGVRCFVRFRKGTEGAKES